jgi:hypothetical protein
MCLVLGYLGHPVQLDGVLFEISNCSGASPYRSTT